MKNLSFERAEERKHERKRERREDETESRVWGLGFGKNKKNRRDVRRSPSSVLREEHEKLKSRPLSKIMNPSLEIGRAVHRSDAPCPGSWRRSYRQPTTHNGSSFREAELA